MRRFSSSAHSNNIRIRATLTLTIEKSDISGDATHCQLKLNTETICMRYNRSIIHIDEKKGNDNEPIKSSDSDATASCEK